MDHAVEGVRRRRTPSGLILGLLVGIWLASLAVPGQVAAHAGVAGTTPADGEHLDASPASFIIEFTEPIGIDPAGVRILDSSGSAVALVPARAEGAVVTQDLPPLDDGWYLASWSVVSNDGHVVHGAIAFAVGGATGPQPIASSVDPGPAVLAIARGVGDLGLLITVGGVGAWILLGAVSVRVPRLVMAAAVVGVVGSLGVVAISVAEAGQAALSSAASIAFLVQAGLLAGVAIASGLRSWPVAGILAAAALLKTVIGGHASEGIVTSALLVAHLAAAALWLGAAPAVLLVLLDRRVSDDETLRVVRRFSKLATLTLFGVVLGGSALAVLLTGGHLENLDLRWVGFLGAKVALVMVAAILGALTRRRLGMDAASRHDLRRLFAVDAVILVTVIALSAGLTVGPPTANAAGDDDIHIGHCAIDTDGGVVNLSLVPAQVGANTVYLDGAGELVGALVELRVAGDAGAIEVELARAGAGWSGVGSVPVAGVWQAIIALQRDRFTETKLACELQVEP